jgi:hypothetical protein
VGVVPRGGACDLRRSPGRLPGRARKRTEVTLGRWSVRLTTGRSCAPKRGSAGAGQALEQAAAAAVNLRLGAPRH